MEGIYLEKINRIEYFIESFKKDDFVEIGGTAVIEKSAFAHSDVEKILFQKCPPNIGENAFEDCKSLTTVIFGKLGKVEENPIIKNLTLAFAGGDFTIQANAFKDCAKLTTLVLPELPSCYTLNIKEGAFCGCLSLRTVVALCDNIEFAEDFFADYPKHLTFICKKDSEAARFLRENGYRSVCIDCSV